MLSSWQRLAGMRSILGRICGGRGASPLFFVSADSKEVGAAWRGARLSSEAKQLGSDAKNAASPEAF